MPRLKKAVIFTVVASILFLTSGCSRIVTTERFLESYQLKSGTIIDIYNQNGSVTISGWDQDKVEISAVKESYRGQEALDQVDIFIDIAKKMTIRTIFPEHDTHVTVSYDIKIPEDLMVEVIECSNGNINLDGVAGNPVIITSNGTVTVKNINGAVTAQSSNGDITVIGVKSLGDLRTSNGNINAELLLLHDNLDIRTNNGSITLALPANLRADLEASTANGTISISNLKIATTNLEQTALTGVMNGGGYKINISTSNGSINLIALR